MLTRIRSLEWERTYSEWIDMLQDPSHWHSMLQDALTEMSIKRVNDLYSAFWVATDSERGLFWKMIQEMVAIEGGEYATQQANQTIKEGPDHG